MPNNLNIFQKQNYIKKIIDNSSFAKLSPITDHMQLLTQEIILSSQFKSKGWWTTMFFDYNNLILTKKAKFGFLKGFLSLIEQVKNKHITRNGVFFKKLQELISLIFLNYNIEPRTFYEGKTSIAINNYLKKIDAESLHELILNEIHIITAEKNDSDEIGLFI